MEKSKDPVLNPSIESDHPEHIKNHKPRKEDFDLPPIPKDHSIPSVVSKGIHIKNIKDCPFKKKPHKEGFLVSSLPPSERKAYMQHNQDQNHECWTREDYHVDKIEVERTKKEKKQKDTEDTLTLLSKHMIDLTNQLNEITKKLKNVNV